METPLTVPKRDENQKPSVTAASSLSSSSSLPFDGVKEGKSFMQWVDILPDQLPGVNSSSKLMVAKQRSSMDLTESNSVSCHDPENENDLDMMDVEDWPDSNSLEGKLMPHYLLVEHDPVLQHELALQQNQQEAASVQSCFGHNSTQPSTVPNSNCSISLAASGEDPSIAPELFANSLEELMEQRRRHLATMMQASMRTRQCLEPHIRQRAGLSNVLSQIERSSWTIQEHLLLHSATNATENLTPNEEEEEELPTPPENEVLSTARTGAAMTTAPSTTVTTTIATMDGHSVAASTADTCNSVDMTGVSTSGLGEDGSVEDFAAAVLNDPDDCFL